MTIYTLKNLKKDTPKQEQEKLTNSLNKLKGITGLKITPERRQVSFEATGTAPTFESVRKACSEAGFQVESQG